MREADRLNECSSGGTGSKDKLVLKQITVVRMHILHFGIVYNPPKSNGRAMTDHTVMCVDDITQKHPYAGVVILGDSNRLRDASLSSYSLKQIVVGETRGRAVLDKIFTNIADWYKPSVILPDIGQSDHSTVLMLPNNQPRCQREGGGKRGLPPTKKLPPLGGCVLECMGTGKAYYLFFVCIPS